MHIYIPFCGYKKGVSWGGMAPFFYPCSFLFFLFTYFSSVGMVCTNRRAPIHEEALLTDETQWDEIQLDETQLDEIQLDEIQIDKQQFVKR